MSKYSKILLSYRDENALSQHELAELLRVSPAAISRWENNITPIPMFRKRINNLAKGILPPPDAPKRQRILSSTGGYEVANVKPTAEEQSAISETITRATAALGQTTMEVLEEPTVGGSEFETLAKINSMVQTLSPAGRAYLRTTL